MFVRNWIDIIRSKEYIDLIPLNRISKNLVLYHNEISFNSIPVRTTYDKLYFVTRVPECLYGNPPTLISFTSYDDQSGKIIKPELKEERWDGKIEANGVVFIWTKERVSDLSPAKIRSRKYTIHRDDGYPAVMEMTNIKIIRDKILKILSSDGVKPALSCEYLMAHWYKNNVKYRKSGPHSLCFQNYKEYWDTGRFRGYRYLDLTIDDRFGEDDLNELKEDYDIDIFRNSIFLDPLDEMDYIAKRL